jgi:hypothetical protein
LKQCDAGNVRKLMREPIRKAKTSTSLPLEGGGRTVGVKELRDVARDITPHPGPLPPKGRGEIIFDNTAI